MSENKDETKTLPAGDKELDDLLDSALQDMIPPQPRKESIGGSSIKEGDVDGVEWNPSENVWSEEFLQNAAATFQSNMAALLSSMKGVPEDSISQDQITATFQMMAEAAAQVMKPGDIDNQDDPPIEDSGEKPKAFNDVSAAIAQTLENLNANSNSLQDPFNEENLNKMFSGLNLTNPEDGGSNMFVPFMQEMMQSLLSKEVLYPSLKDIVNKYPMWLMDNKEKLSSEDFERYTKQNKLMANVCSELESEAETDPEDVKKKRFEKVLGLMQQMQELGQPPEELAGENADLLAPSLPPGGGAPMGDPNQCKPM